MSFQDFFISSNSYIFLVQVFHHQEGKAFHFLIIFLKLHPLFFLKHFLRRDFFLSFFCFLWLT